MMKIVRILGVFCEDIREEKSGQDTIIGIMPDNIGLKSTPATVPKLGIYIRAYFDTNETPEAFKAIVQTPWDKSFELDGADVPLITRAFDEAKQQGNQLAGIILKGILAPFPIQSPGTIKAVIKFGDEETTVAILKSTVADSATSPASVSPPPA